MTVPRIKLRLSSIRVRFVVASILWVSAATALAGVFISQLYRAHTTRQYSIELQGHLIELAALTQYSAGRGLELQRRLSDPRFLQQGSGFYWQIAARDGAVLRSRTLENASLRPDVAASARPREAWMPGPGGPVLQVSMERPSANDPSPLRYSIAADRRLIDEAIHRFNHDLAMSLTVFAALMIVGAALQIGYGLRPVARIGDDIDRLRRGRIARLPSAVPDEFASLVGRLNALLDAQEAIIQRSRVEAGNLAHALRTPLALVSSEAEQLRGTERADQSAFILGQCERMKRQIDYHMSRARAAGTPTTGYVAGVEATVSQILEAMRRLHAERGLAFVTRLPPALAVDCDPGDLFEMLSNLIDNAAKWAKRDVTVEAHVIGDYVSLDVLDDGPGIAPAQRAHVFDVGARLDEQVDGSGLGLAITRDLALLYGGDLDLADAPRCGLKARLLLPIADDR